MLYEVITKFIRPGAVRIGFINPDEKLRVTAAQNPDGSIVLVALNQETVSKPITIKLGDKSATLVIGGEALQTVLIDPSEKK